MNNINLIRIFYRQSTSYTLNPIRHFEYRKTDIGFVNNDTQKPPVNRIFHFLNYLNEICEKVD